ncbi:MAG: zinc ribbon domain-containing protein [Deferribacteres bacterium]|nr:zinc ribbon domain-containing protein [Deferribacteres bacterium]
MPIYEFRCKNCGVVVEKICRIDEEPPLCPTCRAEMVRCFSTFSFKSSNVSEREKRVLNLAAGYLRDGKVEDAHRFLKKAAQHVKTDTVKKAADKLSAKLEG